jgi:hypothetical protein
MQTKEKTGSWTRSLSTKAARSLVSSTWLVRFRFHSKTGSSMRGVCVFLRARSGLRRRRIRMGRSRELLLSRGLSSRSGNLWCRWDLMVRSVAFLEIIPFPFAIVSAGDPYAIQTFFIYSGTRSREAFYYSIRRSTLILSSLLIPISLAVPRASSRYHPSSLQRLMLRNVCKSTYCQISALCCCFMDFIVSL